MNFRNYLRQRGRIQGRQQLLAALMLLLTLSLSLSIPALASDKETDFLASGAALAAGGEAAPLPGGSTLAAGGETTLMAAAQPALSAFYATPWALVPPLAAILLALLTKEVYSSLFFGIVAGSLLVTGFSPAKALSNILENGFFQVLSDRSNVGILIFLVILGVLVSLMNRSGGSAAFGHLAGKHIHTRIGAQLATVFLGMLIFIDDYFNCLTVGSVMRPITDEHRISRAKLAYLIDSTAAPVCIISPISSWAAAVTGFVDGADGFSIFLRAIPYNFYALLTLAMLIGVICLRIDFGAMAVHERAAATNIGSSSCQSANQTARAAAQSAPASADLAQSTQATAETNQTAGSPSRGQVIDLIVPILSLILCCVVGMIDTGGYFSGVGFVDALAQSSAPTGLALGSMCALFFTVIFYLLRRVMSFSECMECLTSGFQSMAPAILILTLAWTLKSMTDSLGAAAFVASLVEQGARGLIHLLPAMIFLAGAFLAFATGTSWGTFGILIPIVTAVFSGADQELMIISISACMAGAVCGDHCSPISDTTIMASAGAKCRHLNHVSTQLPYALLTAAVSFAAYLLAGFTKSAWVSLPAGLLMTAAVLLGIRYHQNRSFAD